MCNSPFPPPHFPFFFGPKTNTAIRLVIVKHGPPHSPLLCLFFFPQSQVPRYWMGPRPLPSKTPNSSFLQFCFSRDFCPFPLRFFFFLPVFFPKAPDPNRSSISIFVGTLTSLLRYVERAPLFKPLEFPLLFPTPCPTDDLLLVRDLPS